MGFFAGATESFVTPQLERMDAEAARQAQIREVLARHALEGYFNPETDDATRDMYRQYLEKTDYAPLARIPVSTPPDVALRRRFGPLLQGAQALGALGQTGLLTPEIAGQIESTLGQGEILPRRTVPELETRPPVDVTGTGPGLARAGLPQQVQTGEKRVIDISRFTTRVPSIRVKLYTGEEVPVEALKGLASDLQMYLIRGPEGGTARTYGDLFGDSLKPEWKSIGVQTDSAGSLRFPPAYAFKEQPSPTQGIAEANFQRRQQAIAAYQRAYNQAIAARKTPAEATAAATLAASRVDPVTFRPEFSAQGGVDPVLLRQIESDVYQMQASLAGLDELARGKDPEDMVLVGNQWVFASDIPAIKAQRQRELEIRQQQLDSLRALARGGREVARAQIVASLKKALGRDPTDAEIQEFASQNNLVVR